MSAAIGEHAPPLDLPGTDGTDAGRRRYTLAEYAGHPVVVIFYPGDGTPVCTRQLSSYTRDIEAFRSVGAQVLAVSPQSIESHDSFSCAQGGFAFPLLADEEKEAGAAWGVLGPLGFYRRSAFVVDGEGIVRYVHRAVAGLTFRATDELVAAVKATASS